MAQVAKLLVAFQAGTISLRAMRLYFAALLAVSAREAARRGGSRRTAVRYQPAELAQLTNLPVTVVRRGLRSLERAGLLRFSEAEIEFIRAHGQQIDDIASRLAGGRSAERPVPFPRPVLRFLARCSRPALISTMLAYCVRGLSLARTGEVRGRGAVKASWLASVCGLSLRAVRSARAELVALRFIERDTGSKQWKLNRDGAYFSINLQFSGADSESSHEVAQSAPPAAENSLRFAPPYKDKKTPIGLKYQRTRCGEAPGVWKKAQRSLSLKRLVPADLQRLSRLKEVFREAVKAGWVGEGESEFLNVVAAAIRANQARGDAVRIFVAIVKRRLWHHVTLAQEARARQILQRDRERQERTAVGNGHTLHAAESLIAQLASRLPAMPVVR